MRHELTSDEQAELKHRNLLIDRVSEQLKAVGHKIGSSGGLNGLAFIWIKPTGKTKNYETLLKAANVKFLGTITEGDEWVMVKFREVKES